MSRGDPVYAKVNIDILTGEKVGRLTVNERDTYILGYWMLAVKYRQERVEGVLCCSRTLANRLTKSRKSVRRHRDVLSQLGLITIHPDKSVTVHGVRARHGKLRWNEYTPTVPIQGNDSSPYAPHTGPVRGVARQHDSTTAREEYVGTLSQDPISYNQSNSGEGIGPERRQVRKMPKEADIRDWSWTVCNGLGIDDNDRNMRTLRQMYLGYPASLVQDAYLATKDRQESDKIGVSEVPLESPLAYMWTLLRKERKSE